MQQYIDLVRHVLTTGTRKENRTGVDTLSTFGYYYEHDLRDGFPLLTTKKIAWKNIVVELLWFLSGTNRSEFLDRHDCRFWKPWTNPDGTVNAAYGPAWVSFGTPPNNQIEWVLNKLKTRPMSRDLVVSAWEPQVAQNPPDPKAYLAPCHCMFVLNVQNIPDMPDPKFLKPRLCLHLTQRSADAILGVPYNIASYALLLSLFARFSGIEPGIFGHSFVDLHIYTAKLDGSQNEYDHIPGAIEQLSREPRPLPKLIIADDIKNLEDVRRLLDPKVTTEEVMSKFKLENYDPHPSIHFKVAV